jgi:hypothetical protein
MPEGKLKRTKRLLHSECVNADDLWDWLFIYLGLRVPREAVCAGHTAPFEYVRQAYFEKGKDLVVWAARGAGKTRLGAAVTLLEMLHKPGISIRILGGSLEQSMKMWEHLQEDLEVLAPCEIKRGIQNRRVELTNGSKAAVLAQSQKAVRGLRVQKLRCDEIELFDRDVWEAAQMVTKSTKGDTGRKKVAGTIEVLSTYHKPWGLMSEVVEKSAERGVEVMKWCLLDVMEKCPPERDCNTCLLHPECRGIAKDKCEGFFAIDDLIQIKRRVSVETWKSEMLCQKPHASGCVFPSFDKTLHVPLFGVSGGGEMSLALDFGFANPFVCLWIRTREDGIVYVADEYVQPGRTLEEHLDHIESQRWGKVYRVACDPAGGGRNEQTAESNVSLLRRRGYRVRTRGSKIADGIELIRAGLKTGSGETSLFISKDCPRLIKAMECYHYGEGGSELPVKDGVHDHLIDALRYYYVNRGRGGTRGGRMY